MSYPRENKRIVAEFPGPVFNRHETDEGMDAYLSGTYTQRNPGAADGAAAFRAFFTAFFAERPESCFDIKRASCEGDYGAVHVHWKETKNDHGSAAIDIFRLANGCIVEHRDAIQPIPDELAHDSKYSDRLKRSRNDTY